MNKLEQYLDQVCRGIGGPVEMRQHIRQELREHLLDAIAQHKAAGMSEEDALKKALEEFGQPEEVRSELEATHGQRMTWIIDKAMQWKERTMKAKWLWVSWAYLGLIALIALEVLIITFHVMFIYPKFQKLLHDGYIDHGVLEDQDTLWMVSYLYNLSYVCGRLTTWITLGAVVAVGLFEWFVRSENKPFMRISALATIGAGLMVVIGLMAGSYVILFCLGIPAMGTMARPWTVEQVAGIESALTALEKAQADKDWPEMQKRAQEALAGATRLTHGPAVTSIAPRNDPQKMSELRGSVLTLRHHLQQAEQAIRDHDEAKLDAALRDFRKAFDPVREAAKKPAP